MRTIPAALLLLTLAVFCQAEGTRSLKSFDGYRLDYEIDYPAGAEVSRAVLLIHGSGPLDMREDLGAVSAPGTTNYFFTDVSKALTGKGFAVIRYNKRMYQLNEQIKKDPAFAKTSKFRKYSGNPLGTTIKDAESFAKFAEKTFPKAKLYLLGHSEGSYVALQAADGNRSIGGVALVGFSTQGRAIAVFEQTVYRPTHYFYSLDSNGDEILTGEELAKNEPVAKSLARQLPALDLDKNGALERSEFLGGNLSNILKDTPAAREWRQEEAARKMPAAIIQEAAFDVSFFQGDLDNQTPSYNAKAIQLLNAYSWKKQNLHFRFFPGLGHALDKRDNYHDLIFRPADTRALEVLAADLDSRWK